MNYELNNLKELLDYIDEQESLTDEYRGSVLLPDFDLQGSIKALLDEGWTEDAIATFVISSNPVLWAQFWLRNPKEPREPLHLFHYQKSMLNCQHRFKVSRCGRQVGKTLCIAIDMIWSAMTREFSKILYVAPYKAQVKVLYEDTLMLLIRDVPDIHNSIVKNPTHPFYKTELSNGSTISAMTAGSKSGNKGSSIRGQSNIYKLYLDEVEYMGSDAINSIMPTISSNAEGHIWASSTPTGKREEFYRWCTERDSPWICPVCRDKGLDGTPFHYASQISPMYLPELDAVNKRTMPAHQYEHEYMAEWGEEVEGVFRHTDIDACIDAGRVSGASYSFGSLKYDNRNKYILGVDWNKESTGVQLVTVEYNPNNNNVNGLPPKYFRVFNRETITSKEFTERSAVARIIGLVSDVPVSHVYADEGYGTLQVEAIRKILQGSRKADIANNIVAINMSSTQEVIDPVTKQRTNKPMKPFMVDNAARIVEDRRLILPDSEDARTLLVGQMREYTIVRRSTSGRAIYSPDNEDILTAFMLALLGFTCEYSEVVKGNFTQRIRPSTSLMSTRASNHIVPRAITGTEDEGRTPIQKDHVREPIFEQMAKGMGMTYEHYPAPSAVYEDPDYREHTIGRGSLHGATGRGTMLGDSNGNGKSRKRFGGAKPVRSKF